MDDGNASIDAVTASNSDELLEELLTNLISEKPQQKDANDSGKHNYLLLLGKS